MKIVQINCFSNGSTGKIAKDYCKEELNKGNEVLFIYSRGPIVTDINSYRMNSNIRIHGILSRLFDNQGLNSHISTFKMIKVLKKFNPDVINLHNIHGYYLNYKMLFKYLKGFTGKIRWTFHDCWPFTGHCAYFSYANCNKWKFECNNCPQKKSYPKTLVFDRSKRNYNLKKQLFTSINKDSTEIICPSQWLADLVKESFMKDYNVIVKHNKIDTNIFKKYDNLDDVYLKYSLPYNKKIILGVAGVWEKRKGMDYFIDIDAKLDHKFYQVVLVGLNDKQVKRLSESTNIICIKRTENQVELAKLYCAANVFFNPTLEENYPTVNLEAQSCGTKVVSFDTGGCKETNYEIGLFELSNPRDYLKKIMN